MLNIPREYLLLFNAITDAEESLRRLQVSLMEAQRRAEELFIEEGDSASERPTGLPDPAGGCCIYR